MNRWWMSNGMEVKWQKPQLHLETLSLAEKKDLAQHSRPKGSLTDSELFST